MTISQKNRDKNFDEFANFIDEYYNFHERIFNLLMKNIGINVETKNFTKINKNNWMFFSDWGDSQNDNKTKAFVFMETDLKYKSDKIILFFPFVNSLMEALRLDVVSEMMSNRFNDNIDIVDEFCSLMIKDRLSKLSKEFHLENWQKILLENSSDKKIHKNPFVNIDCTCFYGVKIKVNYKIEANDVFDRN